MDNVYVQKARNVTSGPGIFYVVLPGVTATIEEDSKGGYEVTTLKADSNYLQMQKDKQNPGLWRIDNTLQSEPKFQSEGSILKQDYRPVVISDRSPDSPLDIAKAARNDLVQVNSTIGQMVKNSGFDLHHTPGDGSLIGLKPAKKALATTKSKDVIESAILLANTMYKARNIEGVLWFSDWGGSAVLTRALQILAHEKSTTLENHAIFLNRPTSNSSTALKLAKDLQMNIAGTGKKAGYRPSEVIGNHLHSNISSKGAFSTGVFGISSAGAAFSIAGAAPSAAGIIGLAGAMYFIGTAVSEGAAKFSGKKYK